MHLYQKITERVDEWRGQGYPCADYPAIGEILDWAKYAETGSLRFLRPPQLRAVETYWYLRLIEKTAHINDLYEKFFLVDDDPDPYLEALGIPFAAFKASGYRVDKLITRLKTDDDFVAAHKMEALRETLTLAYPSYILALAMGAGKTILIGAIIATEFAMGMEYPQGDFVQNALVFAPGTTIVESLREIADIPYPKILPPRLYASFEQSVKLTFTRDGEKTIPIAHGSLFNIVVTNTEKIRIQKPTARAKTSPLQLKLAALEEQKTEEANLRLQAIASLPHLAVFSDEAHHTFGQAMGEEIKRVRQTINYLHTNSPNLICVVNTTGTPYYEKQPLKDVVIWYGLSQGISDNILKDVADNIQGYGFDPDDSGLFVREIIRDFFATYADVRLPNGAPAKLALYFPQNDDLNDLRRHVEIALTEVGQPTTIILKNTSESSKQDVDAFNALNDPASLHRVILLVNKGTEGWNCPSLFACALVRKLKSSNNFVLQAATRCLRQVVGNTQSARMYLSKENRTLLETQLQETYGETLSALNSAERDTRTVTLTLRKMSLPPLTVTQTRRSIVRKAEDVAALPFALTRPKGDGEATLTRAVYTPAVQASVKKVLQQVGETEELAYAAPSLDLYTAAADLAAVYRLPFWTVYNALQTCYGGEDVPQGHLDALARQIEAQTRFYEVREHQVEVALAIVKPSGFDTDAAGHYVTEINVSKAREAYLLSPEQIAKNDGGYGFHFAPYNFDSAPEKSFFDQMLLSLNQHSGDIEDIYFTGGFTSGDKTDFFVEYQDALGKWRSYTPDFLIHRKDGKWLIVEVKAKRYEDDDMDGREGRKAKAVRRWQELSKDQIKYEIFFAEASDFTIDEIKPARRFVQGATL